jgi:uncharacterized membrane protein SpoIIM required for sporulation
MKETRFIAQNKEKWLESEMLLKDNIKDPEKLSNLFTQVMDDLSYSRTHYPNRSVRVYLNKIGREYFSLIYDHKKEKKNRFSSFWLDEIPQIMLYAKKEMIISLLIFLLAASIGIFSSIHDPEFTSTILGRQYVEMTKENISNGDPMAVYKKSHQVDMFLGITFNNLRVAFMTYVFGVFLSIGTIGILLYNGVMVGCFQFFFIERGLLLESALSIWLHGTLEISSIILAGGAGLTLGSGLVFPGSYSRLQAFQVSGIRSLKLMLGISPVFVLAAIIESFLTRYTDMPEVIKAFLILLSAVFIIGYFVVYPWIKSKKGFDHPLEEVRLSPVDPTPTAFDRIKNNAEILKDTFQFYRTFIGKLLPLISIVSLLMAIAHFVWTPERIELSMFLSWYQTLFADLFFALKTWSPAFIAINAVGTGLILYRVYTLIDLQSRNELSGGFSFLSLGQIVFCCGILFFGLHSLGGWGTFLVILAFLVFLLANFVQHTEGTNLFQGISRSVSLVASNFGQTLGLQAVLLLMTVTFLLILSAPLLYFNLEILQWNFGRNDEWAKNVMGFIEVFIKVFAFNLVLPIVAAGASYLYFALREVSTADNLKRAIERVGTKQARR